MVTVRGGARCEGVFGIPVARTSQPAWLGPQPLHHGRERRNRVARIDSPVSTGERLALTAVHQIDAARSARNSDELSRQRGQRLEIACGKIRFRRPKAGQGCAGPSKE